MALYFECRLTKTHFFRLFLAILPMGMVHRNVIKIKLVEFSLNYVEGCFTQHYVVDIRIIYCKFNLMGPVVRFLIFS